jgi:uncharacterized protein
LVNKALICEKITNPEIMLVEFTVGNFWSFKELQTLQMQAAKLVSKFPKVDEDNTFVVNDKISLLKTKAIYGANASGKSNLVRAFTSFRQIVRDNISNPKVLEQYVIPFKLNKETANQPSFFQMIFVLEGVVYRYGFEASRAKIESEWLWGKPLFEAGVRERYYFVREGNTVEVNDEWYKEGAAFSKAGGHGTPYFRDNSLFLTVVAAFNGPLSLQLVRSIVNRMSIVSGLDDTHLMGLSIREMAENPAFKESLSELMSSVDPSILSLELIDADHAAISDFPEVVEALKSMKNQGRVELDVAINRAVYDEAGKKVGEAPVTLAFQEAEGTKKFFAMSSLIFVVLEKGGVMLVDEFDARMHPKLTRKIVQIFNSKRTNPNNAQLVFITHDSSLLDARLLRRDQIAFAKKDKFGVTELYHLVDFKGIRNDASFEKDYLAGKYGALPNNLNIMESIIETSLTHAEED